MQGDNAFSQLSDVLSRFLHAEAEEAKEALDSNGSKNGVPEPRVVTKKEILADDEFLRDMLISFVQAGRDTSAVTLSWFFGLLACNPRVEKAIYEEISRVHHKSSLPSKDKPESREVNGILFFELLKDMHFDRMRVRESMLRFLQMSKLPWRMTSGRVAPESAKTLRKDTSPTQWEDWRDCGVPIAWNSARETAQGWIVFVPPNSYKYPVFQAGPPHMPWKRYGDYTN